MLEDFRTNVLKTLKMCIKIILKGLANHVIINLKKIICPYPATDCMTLLDMSLMLLNKLLAPFTTPPSNAEFPDDEGAGGPLVLPDNHSKSIVISNMATAESL